MAAGKIFGGDREGGKEFFYIGVEREGWVLDWNIFIFFSLSWLDFYDDVVDKIPNGFLWNTREPQPVRGVMNRSKNRGSAVCMRILAQEESDLYSEQRTILRVCQAEPATPPRAQSVTAKEAKTPYRMLLGLHNAIKTEKSLLISPALMSLYLSAHEERTRRHLVRC